MSALADRLAQMEPLGDLGIATVPANLFRYVGWLGDQGVQRVPDPGPFLIELDDATRQIPQRHQGHIPDRIGPVAGPALSILRRGLVANNPSIRRTSLWGWFSLWLGRDERPQGLGYNDPRSML